MQVPAAAPNRAAFVAALEAELVSYTELCELLRAEQLSLERGDVDHLRQLTELKSRQVERLGVLGGARAAYLRGQQLPATPTGMEEWLRSHAGAQQPGLTRTWTRLLEIAAEARALNELNGGLVALRLNHSQAALAALHEAGRQHLVYGPDGQNDFRASNRDLGRA
jgi:flagella synthesis protein FlgN